MAPGENGEIFEPSDYKNLAKAINKIKLDNKLRNKYSDKCMKIVKPYCLTSVKKELLEIVSKYN